MRDSDLYNIRIEEYGSETTIMVNHILNMIVVLDPLIKNKN